MAKKTINLLLVLCLVVSMVLPVSASVMGDLEEYGVRLIQYYLHHQEKAEDVIWDMTRQMKELDPKQGSVWEKLMFDWAWINSDMPVYEEVLPEGLPGDDSLCIVVMGFGLNADGSMRPELVERLKVGLAFANKYPNAYVLVTGGQTGAVDGITEAGQMADWLRKQGLPQNRILQEKESLSTTANAVNCYKLLTRAYPQVDSVAVVTSDYHVRQSCAMFTSVSNYQSGYKGGKTLELVGNAVCDTGLEEDSLRTQAWGISLILGIPFDEKAKAPELYPVEIPVEVYTEPAETEAAIVQPAKTEQPAPEPEEVLTESQWAHIERWALIAAGVVALVIFWIIMPKKPAKRKRREKPKMNWEV